MSLTLVPFVIYTVQYMQTALLSLRKILKCLKSACHKLSAGNYERKQYCVSSLRNRLGTGSEQALHIRAVLALTKNHRSW